MLGDEAAASANDRTARVAALAVGDDRVPVPAARSGQVGTVGVDDIRLVEAPATLTAKVSAPEPAGVVVTPVQGEDCDGIGYEPVPQSIPHDVMLAGLLAVSDPSRFPVRSASEQGAAHTPATVTVLPAAEASSDPWLQGVNRVQTMEALPGFSLWEWAALQAGCDMVARRVDELRALGWSAVDCCGVDPRTPDAVHAWGLGLLVGSADLTELTARAATIVRPNGVVHTYYRRPCAWAVPIWEVGG